MIRQFGIPKTDEERKDTHQYIYGDTELPPRGTGLARGMAKVFTPDKLILVSVVTGSMTSMGGYALTQSLKRDEVGVGKMLIVGLGAGCIAGLTSFLVTRYIN